MESCKLDFDANSRDANETPAENLSLNQPGLWAGDIPNHNSRLILYVLVPKRMIKKDNLKDFQELFMFTALLF